MCVSGRGDSTNVVEGVNLGVIAESAAVLPDDTWNAIDAADAWASVVAQRTGLWGWENCGVKPEGLPSPSSRRVPTAEGGFDEDVYDGNRATTFR